MEIGPKLHQLQTIQNSPEWIEIVRDIQHIYYHIRIIKNWHNFTEWRNLFAFLLFLFCIYLRLIAAKKTKTNSNNFFECIWFESLRFNSPICKKQNNVCHRKIGLRIEIKIFGILLNLLLRWYANVGMIWYT